MNFALAFGRTLLWRPHRALAALYWYVTGRRVRARNRLRLAVAQAPNAYSTWIETVEKLVEVRASAASAIAQWEIQPCFSILLQAGHGIPWSTVEQSLQSVRDQLYGNWEVLLISPPGHGPILEDRRVRTIADPGTNTAQALNIGVTAAEGDYIIPLRAGDRLSPAALFRYGEALQRRHRPAVLYGDEDWVDDRGRRTRPWFKPTWNEEMFLAQDYVSATCAIRGDEARTALPVSEDLYGAATYSLLLTVSAMEADICHIPHILCHRAENNKDDQALRIAAVSRHLKGQEAEVGGGPFSSVRVAWPLPNRLPLVSIIVPTRDKLNLLSKCVEGVLGSTDYPFIELIIVDNDSVETDTLKYFQRISNDPRVSVLSYAAPYNYSAINNFAAAHATGHYLCLLNNDTEILSSGWLKEMMRQAVRPHVGAVGAKLLYEDGSVQHAGVIIGMGDAAGHAHRFLPKGQSGYFNLAHIPQYVSAVTAACLVVEKRKFDAVGGLDANALAVAFNDVDLCLKLEAAGWRNVYVPQAVLVHHESKSRGRDISPLHIDRYLKELAVLQERWGTASYADPVFNPNFDRAYESFIIRL